MVLPLLFDHCVEEEKIRSLGCSYKQWSYSMLKPGHCPECHLKFKEPVALSCGHSICQVCCDELLEKCNKDTVAGKKETRRQTIRMGMGSFAHPITKRRKSAKLQKSLSIIQESDSSLKKSSERSMCYLSPQCPVCLAPPRFQAPIKNFALEKLIEAWERFKSAKGRTSVQSHHHHRNLPSPAPSSTSSSGFDEGDEHYQNSASSNAPSGDYSIKKCNIAVFGATGVGKSRLVRAQHLNNLFFGKVGSENDTNGDSITELQAKYMIEILDNNDLDGDLAEADGIILAYSCINHESFVSAFKIFEQIKQREMSHIPMILVATKCDIDPNRRTVKSEEADALARHIGCPHMEITARKNIGVNEVFVELVRQIENNSEETLEAL